MAVNGKKFSNISCGKKMTWGVVNRRQLGRFRITSQPGKFEPCIFLARPPLLQEKEVRKKRKQKKQGLYLTFFLMQIPMEK